MQSYKLAIEGHVLEVDAEGFFTFAVGFLISPFELVSAVFTNQQWGQPSISKREFLPALQRTVSHLEANEDLIQEPRIASSIEAVLPALRDFIKTAYSLIAWQEKNIPASVLEKFKGQVGLTGDFILPDWISRKEYRGLLQESSIPLLRYLDGLEIAAANVEDIASELPDPPYMDQVKKIDEGISTMRLMIDVGYAEAIRRLGGGH